MATKAPSSTRIIVAACVGNALEWFDIIVYGYFAIYIAKAFFPTEDETVSLLLALATFALSYFIRPLGGLVLGTLSDRIGRKPVLTWTIGLMTLGTLLMAVTPSYASIGIAAPILVLVSRLLQGFSAGGEFGSATALMLEHLPKRGGFAGSWQFASQGVSTLMAAVLGTVLTDHLSEDQLVSWGFRIPFIIGLLVGPAGLYIRRHVPETPAFETMSQTGPTRVASYQLLFRKYFLRSLLLIGIVGFGSAMTYMFSYIPTFATKTLHLPPSVGFATVIGAAIGSILLYPISGHLSDRFGRVRYMIPAAILLALIVLPAFNIMINWPTAMVIGLVLLGIEVLKAWFSAPLGALVGEVFPTEARGVGMSFSYNAGVAIFGGLTPFLSTLLIDKTHSAAAPAYWLIATAVMAVVCLVVLRRMKWDQHLTAEDVTVADPARVEAVR